MNQRQIDINPVLRALSEQIGQMSVDHAIMIGTLQAEIKELREENEALKTSALEEMDAKEDE